MNKCFGFVLVLVFMVCIIWWGCSSSENDLIKTENYGDSGQESEVNQLFVESVNDHTQEEKYLVSIQDETEESDDKESLYEKNPDMAMDYALLASLGYEVIEKNVLETVDGNVREHSLMKETFGMSIKDDHLAQQELGTEPGIMEYFVYDINDDGLEDYLVCLSGILFEGSHGNSFEIYVQGKDGSLKQVFYVTAPIHYEEHSHFPIAILDDSNAGYHTFVLPWVNTIWSYDENTEWYELCDRLYQPGDKELFKQRLGEKQAELVPVLRE